jgi:GNAT superfamily N-acetyltransferase
MSGPDGIALRPARPEDRPLLIGFLEALNRFAAAIEDDRKAGRAAAELGYEQMLAKIAVHGGAVILAEIAELYVAERFRRSGVGRALMQEAERMIRAQSLPRLFIGLLDGNETGPRPPIAGWATAPMPGCW